MLIPIDIKPEKSLYYCGSVVIRELSMYKSLNIIDLYIKVNKKLNISILIYSLTLYWLYLIDGIYIDDRGEIKLCILKD